MPASGPQRGGTAGQAAGQLAEPVAIVGMDVLLPGAGSLDQYWRNLVSGADAITDVPANRWEPVFYDTEHADQPNRIYCRRGGFVDDLAYFDPMPYGVMPASVPETEPEQLLALRVAAGAIADAGGMDRLPDRDRVGVILGRLGQSSVTSVKFFLRVMLPDQMCDYVRELLPELTPDQLDLIRARTTQRLGPYHPENVIGLMPNLTASRVANRLGLRGPAYILDAACASSLIAVDHGIAELIRGRLDAVVVGGVHHNHDVTFWSVFSQLRALSRRQQIRPFDAAADGLLIGEGTGAVVLKRLSDAVRDGDRVHAVIRGVGVSSDGRSASLVNPETTGQLLAVRRAWASAGLDPAAPDAVGMLEAHGTGTPAGDGTELATMADAFGPPRPGNSPPVIGSVKSMIGHAMPAAGIASLVKTVLAVANGTLLPTLHCDSPREEMTRTRFMPATTARPWDQPGPRRAAVNAFGFGGINVHLIVEQAPDPARLRRPGHSPAAQAPAAQSPATPAPAAAAAVREPDQIVLLAAADPAALARLLAADDQDVRAHGTRLARDGAAGDSAAAGPGGGCRLGIADPTAARLAAARKVVAAGTAWRGGRDIWFSPRPMLANGHGRIAFLFPGLEAEFSHSVQDVAAHFGLGLPEADEQDFSGRFISAMGLGWLLHQALLRMRVRPDAVAGHSLGEWTALLVAGLLDESTLDETAALMFDPGRERTDLQHAVIGASAEAVTAGLGAHPGVVVSIDNAPAQCVVCGPAGQVERLMADFGAQGVVCRPLPFTTGVHTPYLAPAVEQARSVVEDMRSRTRPPATAQAGHPESGHRESGHRESGHRGQIAVWSATIAAPFPAGEEERLELLYRQLQEPVRFRSTLAAMHDAGFRVFLQVGSGQLASLVTDNLRGRDHLTIPVNVASRSGLAQLQRVATALWVEGYAPDLASLDPVARPAPARAATAARSMPIRVELGTERITLGEDAAALIDRAALASPANGAAGRAWPARPGFPLLSSLDLAGSPSVAAELAALLEEAAGAAAAVVSAAGQRAAYPAPQAGQAGHQPGHQAGSGGPGPQSRAAAALPDRPPDKADVPAPAVPLPVGEVRTSVLRVSLADMPYLRDHSFNPQPAAWPNVADFNPVMPATTIIQHMIDAVQAAAPGMTVIGVDDARFRTWVLVEPPPDVDIHVKRAGPAEFDVAFGAYARATVRTAAHYPANPPARWHQDPATEGPSPLSVADMYAQRVMFHGPMYRGVTAVHAVGERHIRGRLCVPSPPGALLDSGLQLVGNWMHVILPARNVMFPTSFGAIRFFGPAPPPGDELECVTRVHTVNERSAVADLQYVSGGRVWAQVSDCATRRFDSHPRSRAAETAPGHNAFAVRQPEGWVASFDYWPDPASQNSIVSLVLGADGYAEYDRQPVVSRKGWLLSRLAVKDVVRYHLWDEEPGREVFPIEVSVSDGADGRPQARGWAGLTLPGYQISAAMARHLGVAIARPAAQRGVPGAGIGVAEIGGDPKLAPLPALSAPELAVLDQVLLDRAFQLGAFQYGALQDGAGGDAAGGDAAGPAAERLVWLARFAAAKEAAAKALGAGAASPPVVMAATSSAITVHGPDGRFEVSYRDIATPPGITPRRYAVAWT
jgi:acyl transferase domain-containing protein